MTEIKTAISQPASQTNQSVSQSVSQTEAQTLKLKSTQNVHHVYSEDGC